MISSNEQEDLSNETIPPLHIEEAIARLKALGPELPAVTELINLQTNNVFAEPGP